MMNGSDGIDGRFGLFDEEAAERKAELDAALAGGSFLGVWLLWQAGKYVSAALLFHQGDCGFWARTAAGGGLSMAFGIVWLGVLWAVRRFDWKSPGMASCVRKLKTVSAFANVCGCFVDGILMAISWQFVLHLIGRGAVESTFGVVTAFMGAFILVLLVWGVFVGFVRVVAGLDD